MCAYICIFHRSRLDPFPLARLLAIPVPLQQTLQQVRVNFSLTANSSTIGLAVRRRWRRPRRRGRLGQPAAGSASSTTGLAARSGLGDRGSGELAACWSSMGRRRTASGGSTGAGQAAEEATTAMASRTRTVRCCFQRRHREGALPPQLTSLCADEILQADVVLSESAGIQAGVRFPLHEMQKQWCQLYPQAALQTKKTTIFLM